jgi:transcriptional regulator with XRE-family HTH domain
MILANRIRQIREAYKLTQSAVAHKCEITPSAYGQIERKANKCSIETLTKIAMAIGVSLPFLVDISSNYYIEEKTSYNLL